jgi:hypothetical protein
MSDLQIWLLVIGAAVVAAVLLFNLMQERRFRKQADAAFQTPMSDALMEPGAVPREMHTRIEPALRTSMFDADADQGDHEVAEPNAPPLHIEPGAPLKDVSIERGDAAPVRTPPRVVRPAPARATAPSEPRTSALR